MESPSGDPGERRGVLVRDVMALAADEAAAASRRTVAEAAWRQAWWETTEALADMTDVEWRTRATRLAEVLGCSTSWLGSRRRTGEFLAEDVRDTDTLRRTPPRLAMEWTTRAKRRLDADGCGYLIDWEAEDKSLRALAGELGTAGRSWASKEELDRREAERPPVTPPSIAQIRAALADPEIAREAVAHGPTAAAIQRAHDEHARSVTADRRFTPLPTNVTQTDRIGNIGAQFSLAEVALGYVARHLADVPMDAETTEGFLARLDRVTARCDLIRRALTGSATLDADLAALLGAES